MRPLLRILFATCALAGASVAQLTFFGASKCDATTDNKIFPPLDDKSYYNASGARTFTWNSTSNSNSTKPWRVDLLVNDTFPFPVTSINNVAQTISNKGYLSVPNGVRNTSVCIYQLAPVNATSNGDESNGCNGILSSGCMDYLRGMVSTTNSSTTCADLPLGASSRDAATAACGAAFTGEAFSAFIEDAGNDTCTYSSLPVGLPEGYYTFQSWDYVSPFANVSSRGNAPSWLGNTKLKTEVYDLHVTQSVPFLVVAQDDVQFVCITPNNVSAGSRTPESREPWSIAQKGFAMHLEGNSALAIGLMGATSLMFML